jgi:hypothetical protein
MVLPIASAPRLHLVQLVIFPQIMENTLACLTKDIFLFFFPLNYNMRLDSYDVLPIL